MLSIPFNLQIDLNFHLNMKQKMFPIFLYGLHLVQHLSSSDYFYYQLLQVFKMFDI